MEEQSEKAPIYGGLFHCSDLTFQPVSTLRTRILELLSALHTPTECGNEGFPTFLRLHLPALFCVLHQIPYLLLQEPSSYTGLMALWHGLFWLRPDYVALQIGLAKEVLYTVWAGIGLLTVLLVAAGTGHSPKAVRSLGTGLDLIVCFPVPLLGILLGHVSASAADPLAVSAPLGLGGVSALGFFLLCSLLTLHSLRSAELLCNCKDWTGRKHYSPAASAVDLTEFSTAALLRYLLSPYNPTVFYLLSGLMHLSAFLFYALRQPLYSPAACEERASGSLFLGWTSAALTLGHLLGVEVVGLLLSSLVGAGLVGVLHCYWSQIHAYVLSYSLRKSAKERSRGTVLLAIRAVLLAELTHEERFKRFQGLREGQRSLLAVVESAYSLQMTGNEALARFQLSAKDSNGSFLDDSLSYRIQKRLNMGKNANSYLSRLLLLAQIHHLDRSLCQTLARFWLSLPSIQSKSLLPLISTLSTLIREEETLFRRLLLLDPDNPDPLRAFAAFMRAVLMRPSQAFMYENRAKVVQETMQRTDFTSELSLNHPSTGVIIANIDGDEEAMGRIRFCNRSAASFLHYDLNQLAALRLFALFPGPLALSHLRSLRSFGQKRTSVSVKHPSTLPLLTSTGFLQEFSTQISVSAEKGLAVLILAFKPANLVREMAVLWESSTIGHTENFGKVLCDAESLISVPVSAYIGPLESSKPLLIRRAPPLSLKLHLITINTTSVQTLILTSGSLSSTTLSSVSFSEQIRTADRSLSAVPATPKFSSKAEQQIYEQENSGNTTVRRLNSGINRVYRLFACTLLASALFVLVWSVVFTVFLLDVTENMLGDSVSVELVQQAIHTSRLAGQGRFLDLTNAGFFPAYMTGDVKNVVEQSVAVLSAIEPLIWARVKTASNPDFQALYLQDSLYMWELEGSLPRPRRKTLTDALNDYRDHGRQVLSLPIANLSIHNAHVYSLVHNGMKGDLTAALMKSLREFEAMEKADLEERAAQAAYFLIAVMLFLAVEGLALALLLGKVHCQAKWISGLFTSLPHSRLNANLETVKERLSSIHDITIYSTLPPMRPHSLYRPLAHLSPWLLILPIGSGLLYFLIYIVILQPQGHYVAYYPTVLLDNGLHFIGLIDLWTWTMEAIFMDSSWPLKIAVPGPSFQRSPIQEIEEMDEDLSRVMASIDDLCRKGYLPYTSPHLTTLMHDSNYSTSIYRKGLRAGFFAYRTDIYLCTGYRDVSAEMYTDCGNLYSAARELVNISADVLGMLRSDFQWESKLQVWRAGDWLLAGAGVGIGYLGLLALPVLVQSRRVMRKLTGLVGLIVVEEESKTKEETFGRSLSGITHEL